MTKYDVAILWGPGGATCYVSRGALSRNYFHEDIAGIPEKILVFQRYVLCDRRWRPYHYVCEFCKRNGKEKQDNNKWSNRFLTDLLSYFNKLKYVCIYYSKHNRQLFTMIFEKKKIFSKIIKLPDFF